MSLLSHELVRVVMNRNEIQLVRIGRKLTLQGWAHRIVDKKIYPCTAGDESYWDDAIKVLEKALSDLTEKPAWAEVILSNHFMSYAMVELNQALNGEAEELAYAKHCFIQLFGAGAGAWELRLNHDYSGARQLASAVDETFLRSLRDTFANAKTKLQSVQPFLMTAYNNCHSIFQTQEAWFVLYEHGSLCLGLVKQGNWSSVRTFNVGRDWFEKLNETLDREAYLSEMDFSTDKIFLWAPEFNSTEIPKGSRWKIHKLKPEIRTSFAPDYDDQFAIAMCG